MKNIYTIYFTGNEKQDFYAQVGTQKQANEIANRLMRDSEVTLVTVNITRRAK